MCYLCLGLLFVPFMCPFSSGFTGLSIFDFTYSGSPVAPWALVLEALLFAHGVAAWGLLTGWSSGPYLGITVCSIDTGLSLYCVVEQGHDLLQVHTLVLVAAIVVLYRVRGRWREATRGCA